MVIFLTPDDFYNLLLIQRSHSLDEPAPKKRLTRVERARLEAFQSFGGSGLDDVLQTSKKIVSTKLKGKENKSDKEMAPEEETAPDIKT